MKKNKTFYGVLLIALVLLVTLVLLAACGGGGSTGNSSTSSNTVTMGATSFNSSSITVTKGSTIVFTTEQSGTAHHLVNGTDGQAHVESGAPDFSAAGQTVGPGQSWTSPPWNTAGTFHVTCTYHPTTMTMTVTVTG